MFKRFLLIPVLAFAGQARAQTATSEVELANLHEEVSGLSQRVGELTLRVEQLEAENARLRDQFKAPDQAFATVTQLNAAVAALNKAIEAADEDRPARKGGDDRDSGQQGTKAAFPADFPKEGINYTVRSGDTLEIIARRTGARISDIINANKIADPSRIQAGESLFIPGGK
jgi:nucleoid-associated protein YgaU